MELLGLGLLGAVLASGLTSALNTRGIKHAADDGVAQTDVFDTTAAQEHYGVFLEIVADTGNIGGHFHAVGQADTGDFPDSGVRFLGSFGGHFGGHAALEGRIEKDGAVFESIEGARQSDRLGLAADNLSFLLDQLIDGTHTKTLPTGESYSTKTPT